MRRPGVPGLRSPAQQAVRAAVWVAAAAVLGLLAAYASDGVEARGRFVRVVGIWIAFGLGVATPHVILPDPQLRLLQLANPTGRRLSLHQLARWLPVVLALAVPAVVVAARPPLDRALLAEGVLATLVVGLFALDVYATVGERSWDWQDDRRGAWLKAAIRRAPIFRLFVPYGLVPGLARTAWVALLGSAIAIAGLVFEARGWPLVPVLAVGVALLIARAASGRRPFARAFYATSGFWAETFQTAAGTGEEREPAPFEAVYWVPGPLKPTVWALLVSLDRRLPLGRFVVVGLALVAGLALAGAPPGVQGAALAALAVAKNAAVALTASASVLPRPWSLGVAGGGRWWLARSFVNLRWTPLVAVAAVLVGLFGERPGTLVAWVALDAALSVGAAGLVTLAAETLTARRLA